MKTLLLDTVAWDLVADASGNIALASNPYALAQDAASAIKLFSGELYYDTTRGVPYWPQLLGRFPPIALMKAEFVEAALTVPEVIRAKCFIAGITERRVTGQVQVTDNRNRLSAVNF